MTILRASLLLLALYFVAELLYGILEGLRHLVRWVLR